MHGLQREHGLQRASDEVFPHVILLSSTIQKNVLKWSMLVLLSSASQEVAFSVEIRTYQFESGSYSSSCGECSRWFNVHANIQGSFSVAIDYLNKRGALLDFDARITEAHEVVGRIIEVDEVQRFTFEVVPIPLESFGTELNFDWIIGSGWEGFLSVDGGAIELNSSPSSNEEGNPVLVFQDGYTIVMEQNGATFSMSSQAIDFSFGIGISEATRVIPEPTTFALAAIVLSVSIWRRKVFRRVPT